MKDERLGLCPIRMNSLPESDVARLLEGDSAKVPEVERNIAEGGNEDGGYWITRRQTAHRAMSVTGSD
jgi:hypothetical protein